MAGDVFEAEDGLTASWFVPLEPEAEQTEPEQTEPEQTEPEAEQPESNRRKK